MKVQGHTEDIQQVWLKPHSGHSLMAAQSKILPLQRSELQ